MPSLYLKTYGLAIHTTSPQLGVAIANFADDTRSSTWDLGRDMSTHLHQYLAEFLMPQTWADLAFIAVAKGPGGFTGTRIGVVTARTLAQQLDIPLFAISALAAVAWAQPPLAKGLLELEPPQPPLAKGGLLTAEPPLAKEELLNTEPPLAKEGLLNTEPPVAKGGLLNTEPPQP